MMRTTSDGRYRRPMAEFWADVSSDLQVMPDQLDVAVEKKIASDAVRVRRRGFDQNGRVELELRIDADSKEDAKALAREALARWASGPGARWSIDVFVPPTYGP
jgi:hypothetical protein